MKTFNGFTEARIIDLLRFAIELAGDGGIDPWRDGEYAAMCEYLEYLKTEKTK